MTDIGGQDQLISRDIEPLFFGKTASGVPPIDWEYAQEISAALLKGRYYFAYRGEGSEGIDKVAVYSLENQAWFFYDRDTTSLYYDEEDDIFLLGDSTGDIQSIELPSGSDDVTTTVQTPNYFGQSQFSRKMFSYLRIDAKVDPDETLTVTLLVDSVDRHSFTLTGSRSRTLRRLPSGLLGYTWALKFEITGKGNTEIYGGVISWMPMEFQ